MNDLMTLESEDIVQVDKFHQLGPAEKSDMTITGEEDCVLDALTESMSCASVPVTAVSVGATLNTGHLAGNTGILQGSVTSPLLVLTTNAHRGTVEASVLLDPVSSMSTTAPWSALHLSSLHSLAQANLISDTQQQIAKQFSLPGEAAAAEKGKKKRKKGSNSKVLEVDPLQKRNSSKVKFANDLRTELPASPKKQIAIIEPSPNEPKTFVCKVKGCGRTFAWQAHFKYHQLAHRNDRRFVCEHTMCGKRFLTSQRLKVHMRTHTGERPFVCQAEDCGKSFTTAGNLKNHSRLHTGERPYACDIDGCGRRFAEYSSLHKHSLTHSGAKPFSCEICGKSFSQSGSRRVHMNRHKLDAAKKSAGKEAQEVDMAGIDVVREREFKSQLSVKIEQPNDVLVLCNSHEDAVHYQDVQTAESVVFPQGLTDHIVTVTTQPADGEGETLQMTHDILGAEEVLVDEPMAETGVGSSVVVLSQPPHLDGLHPALTASLSHPYHHHHHHHAPSHQPQQEVGYDHTQLLNSDLHQGEITAADAHVLAYPPLDAASQDDDHAYAVAEEIEVGVSSSSSSHPQSGASIHMDPMMESDEEYDTLDRHAS